MRRSRHLREHRDRYVAALEQAAVEGAQVEGGAQLGLYYRSQVLTASAVLEIPADPATYQAAPSIADILEVFPVRDEHLLVQINKGMASTRAWRSTRA